MVKSKKKILTGENAAWINLISSELLEKALTDKFTRPGIKTLVRMQSSGDLWTWHVLILLCFSSNTQILGLKKFSSNLFCCFVCYKHCICTCVQVNGSWYIPIFNSVLFVFVMCYIVECRGSSHSHFSGDYLVIKEKSLLLLINLCSKFFCFGRILFVIEIVFRGQILAA